MQSFSIYIKENKILELFVTVFFLTYVVIWERRFFFIFFKGVIKPKTLEKLIKIIIVIWTMKISTLQ